MWVDCLDRNIFIKSLYREVPHLKDIRINGLSIKDEGNRVTLGFDMPYYAEFPPQKWSGLGYRLIFVEVDLFGIKELAIKSSKNTYRGDILIEKDDNHILNVKIEGAVNATIQAECGLIQRVSAY
ncbi:hypothetical protein SDC9_104887 [bioreactor metagenome]|uniref:Immunity protein 50 of polymorphic toxin system n=1 Tax=bioreactor metagenome TaxID=1076179 RepID=A0A645AZ48_9ZZZZ